MSKLAITWALAIAASNAACSSSDATPLAAPPDHAAPADHGSELPTMSLDEVEQAIAAKSVRAVDCNGDPLRKKLGVVPGAIAISAPDTFAASELPADKTAKLVFYCSDSG